LISVTTSSRKRMRFSSEPPYQSVRLLVLGERKLEMRYPWQAWTSTMSKSAVWARLAACPKSLTICRISAKVNSWGAGQP